MNATKIIVACLSASLLFGCASRQQVDMLDTNARADATSIRSQTRSAMGEATSVRSGDDFVREMKTPILDGRPTPVQRQLPVVFSNPYFINPISDRRLIDIVKQLSSETGITITARDDVYNPTATNIQAKDDRGRIDSAAVQLVNDVRTESNLEVANRVLIPGGSRYSGTVEGFLDYLSSVLNISWQYLHDENRVLLTRYVERSYTLFLPPSASGGDDDQSDIWDDTQSAIGELLSQGGAVSVNQLAGTISVVDTADVQKMVADYITKVNKRLAKQVRFRLQVLSVALEDEENKGFNFDFMHSGNNDTVSLSGGGVSIPGSVGLMASVASGPFKGTEILQQNLREKGEVTTSLDTVILAKNNQQSTVQRLTTVPVITEFTPPVVDSNGNVTAAGASLEDVQVGFVVNLVPSIMDDGQNMVVRLDLETSNIDEIIDIPLSEDGQFVQSARTTRNQYEQVFDLRNAETIVITGLADKTNEFRESKSSFGWLTDWLFTRSNDKASRKYNVMLLTPVIGTGGAF